LHQVSLAHPCSYTGLRPLGTTNCSRPLVLTYSLAFSHHSCVLSITTTTTIIVTSCDCSVCGSCGLRRDGDGQWGAICAGVHQHECNSRAVSSFISFALAASCHTCEGGAVRYLRLGITTTKQSTSLSLALPTLAIPWRSRCNRLHSYAPPSPPLGTNTSSWLSTTSSAATTLRTAPCPTPPSHPHGHCPSPSPNPHG
jgi:hypothetical protein